MRSEEGPPVKGVPQINLSLDELHSYLVLLTRLRADDLLDEDSRRRAIEVLTRRWVLAREVTSKQSSVSQGEHA